MKSRSLPPTKQERIIESLKGLEHDYPETPTSFVRLEQLLRFSPQLVNPYPDIIDNFLTIIPPKDTSPKLILWGEEPKLLIAIVDLVFVIAKLTMWLSYVRSDTDEKIIRDALSKLAQINLSSYPDQYEAAVNAILAYVKNNVPHEGEPSYHQLLKTLKSV